MRLQTSFIMLFFLHVAVLRSDSLSTWDFLFPAVYQLGSNLGHSEAFVHTDEVSPRTQFQGLNLSRAWIWGEIFYSQEKMQKTGKHELLAKGKYVNMAFLKIWFIFQCKLLVILWLKGKIPWTGIDNLVTSILLLGLCIQKKIIASLSRERNPKAVSDCKFMSEVSVCLCVCNSKDSFQLS